MVRALIHLFLITTLSIERKIPLKYSSILSASIANLPLDILSGSIKFASIGVKVKDIIIERIDAKVAANANSFINIPTIEDIFAIGKNTIIFVRVDARTATITSVVPL